MPIIKSAIKKLRKDKKRTKKNQAQKGKLKDLIKAASKKATPKDMGLAFSAIDKAAKRGLIHKNKAARLKASLSRVMSGNAPKQPTKLVKKEAAAAKSAGEPKEKKEEVKIAKPEKPAKTVKTKKKTTSKK